MGVGRVRILDDLKFIKISRTVMDRLFSWLVVS